MFLSSFVTGIAHADEQPWLNLLRPDSLVGWNYGKSTEGWSMKDGVLTAGEKSEPLLSGFSVGDFELHFHVEDLSSAGSMLNLVDVKTGKGFILGLETLGDCVVKRAGGKLTTISKKKGTSEHDIPPESRYTLGLTSLGPIKITQLQLREPPGEPLFNGRDLTGWQTPGNKDTWVVEEGKLIKRGNGGGYLQTEKEYANFTLSLDYKLGKGDNSGIGIRTPRGGWPSSDGMELQLLDKPGTEYGSNMSIYRNVPPLAAPHKSEEWNHAVIKADGYMISAWVNGELVQHGDTYHHPELKFRHLKGWIGFQDHGGIAEFKNVNLLVAPDGLGPAEWTAPRTPDGAELVLDRLMNQEVLSKADGIRSDIVEVSVFSQEEKTLLDVTGPGALVGINVQETGGTLAFYFDDESKPRFAGPVKALRTKLPILSDQPLPLVTYVPYAKRLRIVQLPSVGGRYLFEYVTFPKDGVRVNTLIDSVDSIPRGWLATIDYRHNHYKYGQIRQNDPEPRAGEKDKTIEPGSAVQLLSLEGAGIVQWLTLHTSAATLDNDDLWLEITVDGESEPAIAAPARYLFAPVADGVKHNNFLFTYWSGFFSQLAMPYGKGITVLAKNKGDKPLTGIGITASYIPAKNDEEAKAIDGRMRLRGNFMNAQALWREDFGAGRIVGLVYDNSPQMAESTRGKLLCDGKALPGWKLGTNSLLMGVSNDLTNDNAQEAESRRALSGHTRSLAWRYFLLAPPEFSRSLGFFADEPARPKLLLYYLAKP